MTRETKISLLVGLAFIIVIGILLSDHFHATQELPQAILTQGADIMKRATETPGTGNPPINFVAPTESSPTQPVPTHDEMTQPPSPVIPTPNYGNSQASANPPAPERAVQNNGAENAAPDQALANVAQRHGESVVPANIDGSSSQTQNESAPPAPVQVVAGPKQYRAEDGDTVSRMALKFLGGNTRANREAIINANPSLQDDPDKVIVGKMYKIPVRGQANNTDNAVAMNQNDDSANPPSPETTSSAGYFYTVQEGDSLWAIANDQLGDPGAVDKIKQMNESVLKGDNHDVVIPGMKLRLPAKPVATAQN
jgi:nucleoid-associated protein YgaU